MDVNSWEVFESLFSDRLFESVSEVHSLACNEDFICVGMRTGQIQIFDLNNEESFFLNSHSLTVNALCLSENRLISGGQDSNIIIWNLATRTQEANLPGHENVITGLGLVENALYSTSVDQTIKHWDLGEVAKVNSMELSSAPCCLKLDNFIYIGTEEGNIEVVSYTFEKITSFVGHLDAVWCIDVLADIMVSGSYDGSIRLWNRVSTQGEVIGEHEGVVNKVGIIDPSGAGIPMIISVGSDKIVKLWALDGLKDVMQFHTDAVSSLAFVDMAFVTAGFDKKIRLWSLMNHLKVKKIQKTNKVQDLAVGNTEVLVLEQGKIHSNCFKEPEQCEVSAICYDSEVLIYAISGALIIYSTKDKIILHKIEIAEIFHSISTCKTNTVACSQSKIFFFSAGSLTNTLDSSKTSIDICNSFIVAAGENLTLYTLDFSIISEVPNRYSSVLHSRNEKFLYTSNSEGIWIFQVPGLEQKMCIRTFALYKYLKLHFLQGIICFDGEFILNICEYDVEKSIMLPD